MSGRGRWAVGACAGMVVVAAAAAVALSRPLILLVIVPCLAMLAGMAYMALSDRDDHRP